MAFFVAMEARTLLLRSSSACTPVCEATVKQGIKRELKKKLFLLAENFLITQFMAVTYQGY